MAAGDSQPIFAPGPPIQAADFMRARKKVTVPEEPRRAGCDFYHGLLTDLLGILQGAVKRPLSVEQMHDAVLQSADEDWARLGSQKD